MTVARSLAGFHVTPRPGRWRRAVGAALAALVAAGCTTLTPAQQRSAADVRAMASQTARVYGRPPIHFLVTHDPGGPPGSFREGFFAVSVFTLTSPFRDAIVSHELAHYVLGHAAPLPGGSLAEQARNYQQRELDANAEAVRILVRVKGMSEEDALRAMYEYLAGVQRALDLYPSLELRGHLRPCDEIADLLGRFPAQRSWTALLECAPPAGGS